MNEFDKSFISKFEINDLTEEEINNLRIQRNKIDKILNSYEANKSDLQSVKNELYVGKYFKYAINVDTKYYSYIKILSSNPFNYLEFYLCGDSPANNIIHVKDDFDCDEYFNLNDDFFNLEENDELNFDNLIEITEEEFNTAMDRKYQEFKQELSNIPNNIEVDEKGR